MINDKESINKFKEFNEQQMKILNNSLKIKNTLIIGEKSFHDFIKDLNLPTKTYFLQINEVVNFCNSFKDKKIDNKYVINKYFIIIDYKLFNDYYKSFNLLSTTYGMFFIFLIYIENE